MGHIFPFRSHQRGRRGRNIDISGSWPLAPLVLMTAYTIILASPSTVDFHKSEMWFETNIVGGNAQILSLKPDLESDS